MMNQKYYLGINPGGFHRLAYVEWGEENSQRTIVCVHGLTRNSRDFDYLATDLSQKHRIVCPDVVGRGKSNWLADPQMYGFAQYLSDMTALLARLDVEHIDWIGTSMGGLMGMLMAAQVNSPILRLVINDVGPMVPWGGTKRIMSYISKRRDFANLEEAEMYFRTIFAPFGHLTDEQWSHVTRHSTFLGEGGRYELAYDQNVLHGLRGPQSRWERLVESARHILHRIHSSGRLLSLAEMWPIWERVTCPVLLLRGEFSDILLPETVDRMRRTNPKLEVREFKGVGHAPALMAKEQIKVIRDWLEVSKV